MPFTRYLKQFSRRVVSTTKIKIKCIKSKKLFFKKKHGFQVRYVSCPRDGSKTAATSKMQRFVIIINSWKPLAIITKRSIMDVAAALDPPLCPWYLKILNR